MPSEKAANHTGQKLDQAMKLLEGIPGVKTWITDGGAISILIEADDDDRTRGVENWLKARLDASC